MPKTKTPPLRVRTPVKINIAQGAAIAQGIVTAAKYDDGWMYRIEVTGGDDCRTHRNETGELWVCDFEVSPSGAAPNATGTASLPHTVEIVDDLMVVLDEDGNGCDCHELRSLRKAMRQLRRWQDEYTFDYAAASTALSEFFISK